MIIWILFVCFILASSISIQETYSWILENKYTPYMCVVVDSDEVCVPGNLVSDGRFVIDMNPVAIRKFRWEGEYMNFSATFSGAHHNIKVPVSAIAAIYAKETNEGISYE